MKVIYDDLRETIFLNSGGAKFKLFYADEGGNLTLDINKSIPINVATKIFQRWHQIEVNTDSEFISRDLDSVARALNDALNSELTVWINDCSTPVYHGSCFDSEMIRAFICDNSELVSDEFHFNLLSVKHNITEDRVEYFIDDKLKGWLPIIRKEIAS